MGFSRAYSCRPPVASGGRGAHIGGGAHDCLLDPRIGHAAAEIAVHMRDHFILRWIGILGEQRSRLHDLAGLAVAALRHLLGDPCLLQGMIALGAEAFDGGDFLADGVADRSLAGANRLAVDVNRAGAAETRAAPEFRAGHLQLFADDPKQRRVTYHIHRHIPPVDVQGGHVSSERRCLPVDMAIRLSGHVTPSSCGDISLYEHTTFVPSNSLAATGVDLLNDKLRKPASEFCGELPATLSVLPTLRNAEAGPSAR